MKILHFPGSRGLPLWGLPLLVLAFCRLGVQAQKKEIRSGQDWPVANYTTAPLRKNKPDTDAWMKQTATAELKHLDSIRAGYRISNTKLLSELIMLEQLCFFINGNWPRLQYADTVLRQVSLPTYLKKAGLSDFRAYAITMVQQPADFAEGYKRELDRSLASLDGPEKEQFIRTALTHSNEALRFEGELAAAQQKTMISDTALFPLFADYVYGILGKKTGDVFRVVFEELLDHKFTRADTLRGSLLPERTWWNVLRYEVTVKPDFRSKTISGQSKIQYEVVEARHPAMLQIDLQEPLRIDSIFLNEQREQGLVFTKEGNTWHVAVPDQQLTTVNSLLIYYHGKVHEAVHPPWDGGWTWAKDSLGRPWMTVSCQGIGASIWYPCKDHQSDEPDNGAFLSMIVPDSLVGVANGQFISKKSNHDGTSTYKWGVVNPINNYELIPYIGKYVNFKTVFKGGKGPLPLGYWVMDYHLNRGRAYLQPEVTRMLTAFENWFGPYPWYEDGYQLVEAPEEISMEHQSAVAYGGGFHYGFFGGEDLSGTGWGRKWDYMIVHESGHEWFGNNITTKDLADVWIHEGFTCYSETLYTEYYWGVKAGNEYNYGMRKNIANIFPLIGRYGVNDDISERNPDVYYKGAVLLQTIRHSVDDEDRFKTILKGLNDSFYHQTVTTAEIEQYISRKSGFDFGKVFDQYLRTVKIPRLEYYFSADQSTVFYRYTNCVDGFNLPLVLRPGNATLKLNPDTGWKSSPVNVSQAAALGGPVIENMYYVQVKKVNPVSK